MTSDIRAGPAAPGARPVDLVRGLPAPSRHHRHRTRARDAVIDAAIDQRATTDRIRPGWASSPTRSVCIGCKACEVACKEWNHVPEDGLLAHRHVLRQHRGLGADTLAPRGVHRASHARPTGRRRASGG